MTTNTILSAKQVNLWFGNKHILKNINADFAKNEVTALIGPSGCGKSTFLRCFNRMHDLNADARVEGTFLLEDTDIYAPSTSATEVRRRIGMVFQKANPFPKSIYENINYGLKINGYPEKDRRQIIENSLKESYIWDEVKDDLKKPATRLSGGQQQRLCIARAVALRPDVILMDEPCSALDPISTARVEDLILELKKDFTIIIVTHNMQQAQRVADKTCFMYLGEIMEYRETQGVFEDPQHELTQKYIRGAFG